MDDSVERNDQGAAQLPYGGDRSAPRWRTRLAVGMAGVVGLATGIGFSAAMWAGAPVSAASTPAGLTRTDTPASTGGSNLYVVDGRSGSATRTGADSWRLDLSGASVLWFRDRPDRGSGSESPASFVAGWSKTFVGSPPYAAVLAPAGPVGHHPTAVKLTDPTYDPTTGTTSVTLTPDQGESVADAAWLSKLTPGAASTDGRVVLFVDDSSPVSSGPTVDDESIVEYFNEILFNEEIYVDVQDLGTQYQLVLSCPEPPSPTIPSPNFLLTMYTADSPPSSSTTCNGAPILLQKAVLPQSGFCTSSGSNCNFNIVLSNRSTGTIYSQTLVAITLTPGINTTIIPNLEPATLPLDPYPAAELTLLESGKLNLCSSGVDCATPPTNQNYTDNDNVYFQSGAGSGSNSG